MADYDDLGDERGRFQFPHGGLAKEAVMAWSINGFGRRPRDFLARDILFGSLERDRRLWKWRMLCKHKPPWMFDDTLGFPNGARILIAQQRAFHFLHQAHCLDLLDNADDQARPVIRQIRACWPTGSLVAWRGNGRAPRGACRRMHHCPFCFARQVMELYDWTVHALARPRAAWLLSVDIYGHR